MKIAVIGSREGFTYEDIKKEMDLFMEEHYRNSFHKYISGGAIGVDSFISRYCKEYKPYPLEFEEIRPIQIDIGYGIKMNYIFRNIEIITKADKIIAFWNGESRGTLSVINYCKTRGKEIKIIIKENKEV